MIACPHWSPHGEHAGRCALGKAGGFPSLGVCRLCLAGHDLTPSATHQSPVTSHQSRRPKPGTSLKWILGKLGVPDLGTCACNRHAAEMDARGRLWCLRQIPTISRWLMEEAARRRLPKRGDWPLGCALLVVAAVAWSSVRKR